MAGYGGVVEGKVLVGIFTPAFSYPSTLSYPATIKAALADLGLQEDECEFMKQENGRLSCIIKNNKFTLQYVEETYAQNKALIEQLQRAAEALVAFRTKVEEDALLIHDLKEHINHDNNWEIKYSEEHNLRKLLQDKLEKLKSVVNSDHPDANRPKIPKLQLTSMNGTHSEPILTRTATERSTPLPPSLPTLSFASLAAASAISPREYRTAAPRGDAYLQDANTNPTIRYLSSPRDAQAQMHTQNQTVSQPHVIVTSINGKRSISNSNINNYLAANSTPSSTTSSSTSSPSSSSCTSPQLDGISPRARYQLEPSPRSTLSPRGISSPTTPSSPRAYAASSPRGSHSSPRNIHAANAAAAIVSAHSGGKEHLRRHSSNIGDDGQIRRHSNDVGSGRSSPRSKSSSEIPPHYFDLTQPFPDVHSMMPVVHSFSYGSTDSLMPKQRRTVASPIHHSRARSEHNLDFSSVSLSQCRLCSCEKFRTSKAEWMCMCGHANIKHAVFLKASPAPSPSVSPRKIG